MKIIPYHQTETVELERMYVCGNLHRFVIQPWVRDANGQWQSYRGVSWFDSMSQAVVWAISKGLWIGNWDECNGTLEMDAAWQLAYEEWMRADFGSLALEIGRHETIERLFLGVATRPARRQLFGVGERGVREDAFQRG